MVAKNAPDFKWTDDEAGLLLNVTHSYKVKKISENIDWESVKTKYDDILALLMRPRNWQKDIHTRKMTLPRRYYQLN